MGDSKKAARDFVDKYFPVRGEPNSKGTDVLGDLFPPKSEQGYVRKQGYESQSFTSQRATTADGKPRRNPGKSQSVSQKGINQGSHCEMSEPCLMSSSVDYGCRDNYPYNPDCRYPGPAAYSVPDKNERKNGSKYGNPEIQGAEWWQGKFSSKKEREKNYCKLHYLENHTYMIFFGWQDHSTTECIGRVSGVFYLRKWIACMQ